MIASKQIDLTPDEARAIAEGAYVFGFAMDEYQHNRKLYERNRADVEAAYRAAREALGVL